MGQKTFIGTAPSIAQVSTVTINTATNTDTYEIVLADELGNTANVTFTAGVSDTTTTIATGLFNLAEASVDPRFLRVTFTNPSNGVVKLTASSAGVPFYPTLAGTGSGLMTLAVVQASSGPSDFFVAANYAESAVPTGGDNLTLTGNSPILYGTKTGLTLGKFLAAPGFSGACGKPGQNLSFICTSFDWYGTGQSYIDIQSSAIAPNVWNTASQSSPNFGLYLIGSAMTTLTTYGGSVGLAQFAGQSASVTTTQIVGQNAATARVGMTNQVTATTFTMEGGTAVINCALTTLKASGGTATTNGTGAITTVTNNGATIYPNSSGTIGTLNANAGKTDFTGSNQARTVSQLNQALGEVDADPAVVTFSSVAFTGVGPISLQAGVA